MTTKDITQTEELKRLRSRIDWFCDNKVNAFSPTISPAPKSVKRNEIESLEEGIRYFFDRGVRELLVQKKYMGSYCDIYLHKALEDTYFVSRNGHRITHIDLEAAGEACKALHQRFDWGGLRLVIIQSELMPWSVLGRGLIDNEFEGYLDAHRQHARFLGQSGLYGKIGQVKASESYLAFVRDKASLPDKQFKEKYPAHIQRQYNALEQFLVLDLEQYNQGIAVYDEQITHFGQEEAIHFKPFNILKKVYDDGREDIPDDNRSYSMVNDDEMLTLRLDDEEMMHRETERAYQWFATLTAGKEEGVVIKPAKAFIKGLPPAFKVRNNHYLTMIYGVHFLKDLEQNIKKRSIGRKLDCSVNDWMINRELLAVPYNEIDKDNYHLKNLVLDRILGEQTEGMLDKRL
ncbi:DNA ligase-like domain-containing protein [Taibaiella koreensis]|uniref:hypothetical protein n=1 Tax=Taibaiella koreensis TaxID=1268548 RepID=UPI000E59F8B9|nr:hypothetical protein [Taibaiella koreensis]